MSYNRPLELYKGHIMRILAINGSYRSNGIIDQMLQTLTETLEKSNVKVETIRLREFPIEFCLNCRACTQEPGTDPGKCVQDDRMQELIEKIEEADGLILASPTNFGTVTALYKRFMERLVVYAYWPWGKPGPGYRKAKLPKKKALLLSSSAAPGIMGRLFFDTMGQLKTTAKVIGAEVTENIFLGLVSQQESKKLSERQKKKLEKMAKKLL